MNEVLAVAIILLAGVGGGKVARRYFKLPAVTGYIFAGIILGPSVFNIIDSGTQEGLQPINDIAIGVLAVAIGGELRFSYLRSMWGNLCRVFFTQSAITFALVALFTGWIADSVVIGLILGTLSLASAPNTTMAIFREYRLKGDFPRTVLSIVALDNLICLLLFGLLLGSMGLILEGGSNDISVAARVIANLLLSIIIGGVLGYFLVFINHKTRNDNELLVMALGCVFLGVGIGLWLNLQPLFITLLMGLIMVNFSSRPQRFFGVLNRVDTPILVVFLTLAGIKIDITRIAGVGLLGLAYVVSRFVGKTVGTYLGAGFCRDLPRGYQGYLGPALTPQAGIAVGLSIMAERQLPMVESQIMTVILGAVIVFEVVGPALVKKALVKTDSIKKEEE